MKSTPAIMANSSASVLSRAEASAGGYLFVTFKGEKTPLTEQVYFGLSQDGRNWTALNNGDPILISDLGEKGARDPFLLRSHDGAQFYLLATDLSWNRDPSGCRAVRAGSRSILIWESADLVNWSEPRLVAVAPEDAGCAWAPEAVYDVEAGDYLVFWASTTRLDDFAKHRIWAARTKDFKTFSAPFIYIEKPTGIIDTTIVREGGAYFRFSKDEHQKRIAMESAPRLTGPWTDVPGFNLDDLRGYEGPECYIVEPATSEKPATWCLILDHYSKGQGYQPFVTRDLAGASFEPGEGFSFPFHFRHGSVMPVTLGEYQRLQTAYRNPP